MSNYNIVRDYDWTSIPRGSGIRNVAPVVYLKSYKINSSESLNRIRNYANVLSQVGADEFYEKLYGGISEPEDIFFIPFLGDAVRSFSNDYGDTFQAAFLGTVDSVLTGVSKLGGEVSTYNIIENIKNVGGAVMDQISKSGSMKDKIGEMANSIGAAVGTNPGSYVETPKLYQYAPNDAGLEIQFVVSNTINSDYSKNAKLVEHLTRINRPKRMNSLNMEPPRIYEVKIPGVRYIRWASCSNFGVNMLGTKRLIDGKMVPEGYLITMTMTSLTVEVSNFMDKI